MPHAPPRTQPPIKVIDPGVWALSGIRPFSPQACQNWRMRLTDRLNQSQRIVVVIALGMALGAAGIYLLNLGNTARLGWYAYAPLSQSVSAPHTGLAGWLRLIIWLVLIGLWALVSIRVLRPSPEKPPHR
jgi:hypothetical protein